MEIHPDKTPAANLTTSSQLEACTQPSKTPTAIPTERKRSYTTPQLTQSFPPVLLDRLRHRAVAGDVAAQFMLGYALETGLTGPRDVSAAVEWYRKAALQAALSGR